MLDTYAIWDAATINNTMDTYFPIDPSMLFIKTLANKLSDDDCKAIIKLLANEISKENSSVKLTSTIETAILQFFIDIS